MFTDDDFRGIINIGVGSKGGSPSKIGKFGKGALTMYVQASSSLPLGYLR